MTNLYIEVEVLSHIKESDIVTIITVMVAVDKIFCTHYIRTQNTNFTILFSIIIQASGFSYLFMFTRKQKKKYQSRKKRYVNKLFLKKIR